MVSLCSHFLQDGLHPANIANWHDSLFVPSFWFSEVSQTPRSFCPQHKRAIAIVVTRHLDFASQRVPLTFKKRVLLILSEATMFFLLCLSSHPCLTSTLMGKFFENKEFVLFYLLLCIALCSFRGEKKNGRTTGFRVPSSVLMPIHLRHYIQLVEVISIGLFRFTEFIKTYCRKYSFQI